MAHTNTPLFCALAEMQIDEAAAKNPTVPRRNPGLSGGVFGFPRSVCGKPNLLGSGTEPFLRDDAVSVGQSSTTGG